MYERLKILNRLVVIEPCKEGGFFASCPSLQGCHADGEAYNEAIKNIKEVILLRS